MDESMVGISARSTYPMDGDAKAARDVTPAERSLERLRNVTERLDRGSSLLYDHLQPVRDPREPAVGMIKEKRDEPVAPLVASIDLVVDDLERIAERIEFTRSQLHV